MINSSLTVLKRCGQCGQEKDTLQFDRNGSGLYGVHSLCKPCKYKSKKRWEGRNPFAPKAHKINYRDRTEISSINPLSAQDIESIYSTFQSKCFRCGSTDRLAIDHHHPLTHGHPLSLSNAVLLCVSCNSSKGTKDPKEFYSPQQRRLLKQLGVGSSREI
jgi:hypothetical protein